MGDENLNGTGLGGGEREEDARGQNLMATKASVKSLISRFSFA